MNHQKKIKLIISSLKEKEIIQFFEIYSEQHLPDLRKTVKKISFNCFEASLDHRNIVVNGYGKNLFGGSRFRNRQFSLKAFGRRQESQQFKRVAQKNSVSCLAQMDNNSHPLKNQKHYLITQTKKKVGYSNKAQDMALRPKENMMKSVKTIKEEIFESLNRDNIQLRPSIGSLPHQLNKNPSYSMLQHQPRNQQLGQVLVKIKELQQKLAEAQQQNEYLKNRIRENESKNMNISKHISSNTKLDRYHLQEPKTLEKESYLKDISNKFNNTSNTSSNDFTKDQTKVRSYSLSNSINPSAFNSRAAAPKIKIPKLNLQILPNYHGKSNKSLNQSLLQSYQKKTKHM